jgi:alpha-aminoadipic semialdehyde synthase
MIEFARVSYTLYHLYPFIHRYNVIVQPSKMRIFTDDQYVMAGAILKDDISPASVILGVKEVPINELIPNRT